MKFNLTILTIIIIVIPFLLSSQNELILVKNKRKDVIVTNNSIIVYAIVDEKDSTRTETVYYGKFKVLKGDSLEMNIRIIDKAIYPKNGKPEYIKKKYLKTDTCIYIASIHELYRQKENFIKLSDYINYLSITSAALIAPLVSIDIKDNTFRWSIWRKVAGISLGTLALNITTQIFFEDKKYVIKSNKHKDLWKIQR